MICGEALPSLRTSSIQESRSSSEFQKQHEAQCQPSVKRALSELGAVELAATMKEGDDQEKRLMEKLGEINLRSGIVSSHGAKKRQANFTCPNQSPETQEYSSTSSSSTNTSCSTSNVSMATHQVSLGSLDSSSSTCGKEKAAHGAAACNSEDASRDLQECIKEQLEEFAYVKCGTREVAGDSAAGWLSLPVDLPYHAPRVWL